MFKSLKRNFIWSGQFGKDNEKYNATFKIQASSWTKHICITKGDVDEDISFEQSALLESVPKSYHVDRS